ncbi:MAG: hypothetical protein AAGA16_07575 [Cyanobacteria bacterium P01_E01_bin.35]
MVLSCIDTDNFVLEYDEYSTVQGLENYDLNNFNEFYLVNVIAPPNGEQMTWSVAEQTWSNIYGVIGTCSPRSTGFDVENNHFKLNGTVNEFNIDNQLFPDGNQFTFPMEPDGLSSSFYNSDRRAIFLEESVYNEIVESQVYDISESYLNGILSPYLANENQNKFAQVSNVVITDKVRVGVQNWDVTIFLDGEPWITYTRKSQNATPLLLPDKILEFTELGVSTRRTRSFDKESETQAVEVTVNERVPHQKLLWNVDLDENGEETNRTVIFQFSTIEGSEPPFHNLICTTEPGLCPEGTCEVNCGTHACCYDVTGEPVASFEY